MRSRRSSRPSCSRRAPTFAAAVSVRMTPVVVASFWTVICVSSRVGLPPRPRRCLISWLQPYALPGHSGRGGPAREIRGLEAGSAPDREPAGQVGLDLQVRPDRPAHLQFDGVVALLAGFRRERVEGALLVQVDD